MIAMSIPRSALEEFADTTCLLLQEEDEDYRAKRRWLEADAVIILWCDDD